MNRFIFLIGLRVTTHRRSFPEIPRHPLTLHDVRSFEMCGYCRTLVDSRLRIIFIM
jgi:hypothetical protein